jgi:thioredoxin 1
MKLLKFEKDNCPSCKMVDQFLSQYKNANIVRVNPFENPKLAISYKISGVPVTILLDDSREEIKRSIGFKPDELTEMISQL